MTNPLLEPWDAPFGAPPLDRASPAHFRPAYEQAMAGHRAEVAAIAANPAPPDFNNVIVALEMSGRLLARVEGVFHNLAASATSPALQEIELELAPVIAAHWTAITLNAELFARIDHLYQRRGEAGLDGQEQRVLERYHLDFTRAGAMLAGKPRERYAVLIQRLAVLGTQFSQNVLGDEEDFVLGLNEDQMAGVPLSVREAAAACARDRNTGTAFAVTLSRSSIEPMLQFADDRALREKLFRAWTARGSHVGRDNRPVITEMLALRAEQAKLLGHDSYGAFKLADAMAGAPQKARALLEDVWAPAQKHALTERDELQQMIAREGGNFTLAPWDWRYYAEKQRRARFDFDDGAIKPYFQLGNMIAAAFFTAGKLFGLSFTPRDDIPVHHADVRVWEVMMGKQTIGLFYGDYFARPGKQGGAWMSSFRDQDQLTGARPGADVLPLVINNCNFVKSDPCLLSFDDAKTLFHEFGHALHGLLSQVRFPRLSGTNVARDFVELPSQIFEHWLERPEVLTRFARHHLTGEAMPDALIGRIVAARNHGQGFATAEFLASAFIDMDLHGPIPPADPIAAQAESLKHIGLPDAIVPRHGVPHFTHVFGGDGYAAGYYAYLWAEVLYADGFAAFEETGDPFDPATARRLHHFIYAGGGSRDYASAYRAFRGRDANITALLKGRGLS